MSNRQRIVYNVISYRFVIETCNRLSMHVFQRRFFSRNITESIKEVEDKILAKRQPFLPQALTHSASELSSDTSTSPAKVMIYTCMHT